MAAINDILKSDGTGELQRGRLKNQADFYSLVGAIDELLKKRRPLDHSVVRERLRHFLSVVEDKDSRANFGPAIGYYAATRSASNDPALDRQE